MKTLRKFGDFILFGNLFISLCASVMVVQTNLFSSIQLNLGYAAFVFFATMCIYNLQRVVLSPIYSKTSGSGRHSWIIDHKQTLILLISVGVVGASLCVYFIGKRFLFIMLPLGIISVLYFLPGVQLRKFPAVKAVLVSLVWAVVSVYTPFMLEGYIHLNTLLLCIFAERMLFLLSLCIVFNIRDIEHDRISGIQTIPVLYGLQTGKKSALICLAISFLFSIGLYQNGIYSISNLVILGASTSATTLVILKCNEKSSEYYYLLGIDGMMLLPTILISLLDFF